MKKKIIVIVVILLILLTLGLALFFFNRGKEEQLIGQVVPKIVLDDDGSPILVSGELVETVVSSDDDLYKALNEIKDMYGFENAKDEFSIIFTNPSIFSKSIVTPPFIHQTISSNVLQQDDNLILLYMADG